MNVGILIAQAFAEARSRYREANTAWIRISHSIGSRLPESLLGTSIQRDGELDLVLRCVEDEIAKVLSLSERDDPFFVGHYLNALSTYWIGGMYETLRLLKERKLVDQSREFARTFRDFELLRIPLEKHEIAKDRKLKEPLTLMKMPSGASVVGDEYVYRRDDVKRAHIMPVGLSARGSLTWQVTDLSDTTSRWLERRSLSDQTLELWKEK